MHKPPNAPGHWSTRVIGAGWSSAPPGHDPRRARAPTSSRTPTAASSTSARPSRCASACRTTSRTRPLPPRTAQMVAAAETVEWIQVRNDVEALMLEYSLIKQHQPRFNVRLRDDKSYPFLAVTLDDEWPRADGDAGPEAQGRPLLRPLRPRLRHPRDARPAAAHVPDPHLLGQQVRAPPAAGPAVPAVPHREVQRAVRRRDRQGGLRPAGGGAARLPRRRHRHGRRAPRATHAGGSWRARVRAGGPAARPAHQRCARPSRSSRWSPSGPRTST